MINNVHQPVSRVNAAVVTYFTYRTYLPNFGSFIITSTLAVNLLEAIMF